MAYTELTDGISRATFRTTINTNLRGDSALYPGQKSFQLDPIHTLGNGAGQFEILNTGNPGGNTENRNLVPVAAYRHGGNAILARNIQWDQVNQKWLTPYQQADAYGSSMFECGGEAAILHATPSGVDFTDVPHEILLAKASGTDGESGHTVSSGYFTQSKACIFARFNSTAYNPASTGNCWNEVAGTNPLLWLSSGEAKGTDNELARFEVNSNTATAYPGVFLCRSHGTLGTKTVAVTGELTGRIGFKAYDGDEYHMTAFIDAVTRGTMANNAVGQELRFGTSATNQASITVRMALGHDGAIKAYTPFRFDVTTITTIPDYSGNGFAPALTTGTTGQMQPASSTNGGMIFQGFTVSGSNTANAIQFRGVQGHTSPTGANTVFIAVKHNGTTNFTDIAATEIGFQFRNNATVLTTLLGNGNMGFGVTGPTALVHVAASSTARAGLCVVPGAAPTSPVNGDIWIDSTAHTMHVRINGVTKSINLT